MRNIIFAISLMLFMACGKDSIEKTRELNANNKNLTVKIAPKKVSQKEKIKELDNQQAKDLAEIKGKKEKDLAIIESQKLEKLKKLELNSKKDLANIELKKSQIESNKSIAITNIKSQTELKIKKEENSFYKVAVILLALVLVIWLIFKYLSVLAKKRSEQELKERELNHQAYIEDLKLKQQNISKMLDILSDKDSDKDVKKSISKLLERGKGNILERK